MNGFIYKYNIVRIGPRERNLNKGLIMYATSCFTPVIRFWLKHLVKRLLNFDAYK